MLPVRRRAVPDVAKRATKGKSPFGTGSPPTTCGWIPPSAAKTGTATDSPSTAAKPPPADNARATQRSFSRSSSQSPPIPTTDDDRRVCPGIQTQALATWRGAEYEQDHGYEHDPPAEDRAPERHLGAVSGSRRRRRRASRGTGRAGSPRFAPELLPPSRPSPISRQPTSRPSTLTRHRTPRYRHGNTLRASYSTGPAAALPCLRLRRGPPDAPRSTRRRVPR